MGYVARHAEPKSATSVTRRRIAMGATVVLGSAVVPATFASSAEAASLTPAQVASYAKQGCPSLSAAQINIAVKIAGAESRLNTAAHNPIGEDSRGLWQINTAAHGSPWGNLYEPLTNAKAMCDVSNKGSSWGAWTTYTSGSYLSQPGYTGGVAAPAQSTPSTPKKATPAKKSTPTSASSTKRPESHIPHDHYTVKSGDTLSEIAEAKSVKGGSAELFRWNTKVLKDADHIYPGQELNVPRQGGKSAAKSAVKPAPVVKKAAPKPVAQKSAYVAPVPGAVSQSFRNPSSGYSLGYHTGTDFSAAAGTPIKAAAAGQVVASDTSPAYGINVQIRHADGKYTLYAHMSSKSVYVGEHVSAGEVIGKVGSTGHSSGAHLHMELRVSPTFAAGNFLDSVTWLRSHGVRL